MKLTTLVGSGDKIGLFVLPFLIGSLLLAMTFPSWFKIEEPPSILTTVSQIVLVLGVVNWAWSVILILTHIPKNKLITTGPYAIVKHPLYVGVALLVLPWVGFLFHSWLGLVIGIVIYVGSRRFAHEEEKMLSKVFGKEWDKYRKQVKIPWL